MDVGKHPMRVIRPLREAREVLMNALIIRVIDVRAIAMNQDASIIELVVGIASYVIASLDYGDLIATGLCKATSADRSRKARADHDGVIGLGIEPTRKALADAHALDSFVQLRLKTPSGASNVTGRQLSASFMLSLTSFIPSPRRTR
jgi:hypothetical protein